MDTNHQQVVFKEGDPQIAKRFSQMGGVHGFHEESGDRIINLIVKISGGHIRSRRVATIIGLLAAAFMLAFSLKWFLE